MRFFPIPILALVILFTSAPAQAEVKRLVGFGGLELNTYKLGGELSKHFRPTKDSDASRFSLFGGMKFDDFDVRLSLGFGDLQSNRPKLYSGHLSTVELGPDFRYMFYKPSHTAQFYVRGGLHKEWWSGDDDILRTCDQSRDCVAGFGHVRPTFEGFVSRVGIGVELSPLRPWSRMFLTASFDVGYELAHMKIWNDSQFGQLLTASLHFAIGGGKNTIQTW